MSDSIQQVISDALEFLKHRGSERGLMLLKEEATGQFVVRGAFGMDAGVLAAQRPVALLLEKARHNGCSLVVLDADQDPAFEGIRELLDFRSAVCIPILRSPDQVIGVLYGDSEAGSGVFCYPDLMEAEGLCADLAARLEATGRSPVPRPEPRTRRRAPVLAAVAVFLVVVPLVWGAARSSAPRRTPTPVPARGQVTLETAGPVAVAESFLRQIRVRNLTGAHALLSYRIQEELPLAPFEARANRWLVSESHRWELQYRKVRLEGQGEIFARIVVEPRDPGGQVWRWKLAQQSDGWRIDEMNGAPLEDSP
ncbi:MAG: GAF domain-containing protein [Armatimonadetes bacterium]|nr:GAF domain-containing protein [Armatimonadota bacterium]